MSRFNAIPPLAALRSFEAVARTGGFARAAAELAVSTSAVSHQIRALEDSLGARLIERSTGIGETRVTPAGTRLLRAVEGALGALGEACEELRAPRRGRRRRRVVVSANPNMAALWLAPRLSSFAALHDGIDLRSVLHENMPDLARKGIDLAVLHKRVDDMTSQTASDLPLLEETVFPVCSPDLLATCPALRQQPRALLQQRLLQEDHPESPETEWHTWFTLLGLGPVDPARIMQFSSFGPAVGAAVAGSGVTLGRSPLVDYELASGRLVRLLPRVRVAGSWRYVMRLRDPPDATLQALCGFLRRAADTPFMLRSNE